MGTTAAIQLPFWRPEVGGEERERVGRVLASNYLNDGDVTEAFEHRVAELLDCRHVIAVTSGTAALYCAMAAARIGHGDEVIVPDVTFIATANAVTMTGATPVLCDVDPATLTICPHAIERLITPRTKAIVPVHVSGRAADMDAVLAIARAHGLAVVEDAAEAMLSRWRDGRCLGTLGLAGCFSLSPNKTITSGQGGLVATNNDHLARRLREVKDQGRPARGTGGADTHVSVGYNFKFTNLQAAVGLGQLDRLAWRVERLKAIYRAYERGLKDVHGLTLVGFRDHETPQWVDCLCTRRDELAGHLLALGMQGRPFWHPLHTQAPYRRDDGQFTHASERVPSAFWLPSAFQMTDGDVASVCRAVRAFYGAGRRVRHTEAA